MQTLLTWLTGIAVLGTGISAGLFFVFSNTIMRAFGRLPPANGIASMQSINAVILNPGFFVLFFGTAIVCLALAILALARWAEPGAAWLLAGSALYLAGIILVTIVFNVPLNEALAVAEPASAEGGALWSRYLQTWTMWNHVRSAAGAAAAVCLMVSYAVRSGGG